LRSIFLFVENAWRTCSNKSAIRHCADNSSTGVHQTGRHTQGASNASKLQHDACGDPLNSSSICGEKTLLRGSDSCVPSFAYHGKKLFCIRDSPVFRLVQSNVHNQAVHIWHWIEFSLWDCEQTPGLAVILKLDAHSSIVRCTRIKLSQPQGCLFLFGTSEASDS